MTSLLSLNVAFYIAINKKKIGINYKYLKCNNRKQFSVYEVLEFDFWNVKQIRQMRTPSMQASKHKTFEHSKHARHACS